VAVGAGAWVAGAGAWVAGAGAAVGVADWQATIPASMAIAITRDNSLNSFVDISFSYHRVSRENVAKLSDFEKKQLEIRWKWFLRFHLLSSIGILSRRRANRVFRRQKLP
jgi:hypothetical protein